MHTMHRQQSHTKIHRVLYPYFYVLCAIFISWRSDRWGGKLTSSHRATHAHNETLGEICLTLRCAAYDMSPSCGDDLPGPYCSFCCSLSTRVFAIHIVFGIHARMFVSFANGLPFTQNVVSKRKTRRIFFFKHRLILTSKFYSCHFVCIDQKTRGVYA